MSGDFIDTIHDCPHELGEILEDVVFSQALNALSDNHKEILYYSAIRQYSTVHIADIRNQTDRNIRKVSALLMQRLREKLSAHIHQRQKDGLFITPVQLEFLKYCEETVLDSTVGE